MALLCATLPSAGIEGVRSCGVLLPDDLQPNSIVKVDLGNGKTAEAKVPEQARGGDTLVLTLQVNGSWSGGLVRKHQDRNASCCLMKDNPCSREIVVVVPEGPELRQGQLSVDVGQGRHLTIGVPESAQAGDKLLLREEKGDKLQVGKWTISILAGQREQDWLQLPRLATDSQALFERLVHVVRGAGAFVNPKITRGIAPPLCIPGIVACEDIDAGEEIIRIPVALHLTAAACKKIFPEIFVETSRVDMKGRHDEAAFAACIARLIGKAVRRSSGQKDPLAKEDNAIVLPVWELFAEVLASEPFESHPYVRMQNSSKQVATIMEPCKEHHHLKISVCNVNLFYGLLAKFSDLLGPDFTFSSYWQARLCMMSRSCESDGSMSLIPIFDYFNHHPRPGATWSWDAESQAMIIKADRRHVAGEEILICYGPKSNVSAFLTYGFVLPPAVEPSWSYTCSPQKVPRELYKHYLPASMSEFAFQLETYHVDASLVIALNACLKHGSDAVNFLYAVCQHAHSLYQRDPLLLPAIKALHQERRVEPTSAAWWCHFSGESTVLTPGEVFPDWSMALLYVKMSEYLCLTAYLEIFDVLSGKVTKDTCLAGAKIAREALLVALPMLRDGDEVVMTDRTR